MQRLVAMTVPQPCTALQPATIRMKWLRLLLKCSFHHKSHLRIKVKKKKDQRKKGAGKDEAAALIASA